AGLSEDSDYTSDISYSNQPNQCASYHQANSSSSQYETMAKTHTADSSATNCGYSDRNLGQPPPPQPVQHLASTTSANTANNGSCQESAPLADITNRSPNRPKRELPF